MPASYQVARSGSDIYVRVVGPASMKNVPVLDAFLRAEVEAGARRVCIDLKACGGMDSTFMGTMVGCHKRLMEVTGDGAGSLVIVNPGPSNRKLLDMLGLSSVLPVIASQVQPEMALVDLVAGESMSPMARAELIRNAHEHLVALSESNRAKFGAFLESLKADLKRFNGA